MFQPLLGWKGSCATSGTCPGSAREYFGLPFVPCLIWRNGQKQETSKSKTGSSTQSPFRRSREGWKEDNEKRKAEAETGYFNRQYVISMTDFPYPSELQEAKASWTSHKQTSLSLHELLASLPEYSKADANTAPAKLDNRLTLQQRNQILLKGREDFGLVLSHPQFQANPLGTIREHLTNVISKSQQERQDKKEFRDFEERQRDAAIAKKKAESMDRPNVKPKKKPTGKKPQHSHRKQGNARTKK